LPSRRIEIGSRVEAGRTTKVKSDPRTKTIPATVLTSSREDRDLRETYKLGANSYIVKPVDFEQFSRAVNRLACTRS